MPVTQDNPAIEGFDFPLLIDGKSVPGDDRIAVFNPSIGEAFATCDVASPQQLEAAVAAAKRARRDWSRLPLAERGAVLHQIAARIDQNETVLSRILALEHGKPYAEAQYEVLSTAAAFRYFAGLDLPDVDITHDGTRSLRATRMPHGIVGCISPWNFPLFNMASKVAPALMAGNTVVAKPSPKTPLSTLHFARLVASDIPAGVLNVIADDDDLGDALTSHPDIAMVSFTGSTGTGRKVMRSASATLKRLTLELGGNDAAIVLEGADPQAIAQPLFTGAFANNGQVCMAVKRIYAHTSVYDALVDAMAAIADAIVLGDPFEQGSQIGPIQNRMQFEKLQDYLAIAEADGTIAAGGKVLARPGYFMRPTIVRDIRGDSRLVLEEQFGPILPIVRYDDIETAIEAANATDFGLSASVWSSDDAVARLVAVRLEAGTVWINRHLDFALEIPFGGIKQSGMGMELGELGLHEFTQVRLTSGAA